MMGERRTSLHRRAREVLAASATLLCAAYPAAASIVAQAEPVARRVPVASDTVVRPGDPSLRPSRLIERTDTLRSWHVSGEERRQGSLQIQTVERFVANGEQRLRVLFRVEGSRGLLIDTTVVRLPSLEPIRHSSHLPPGRPWSELEIRYDSEEAIVTTTPNDSTPGSVRVELDEPAFDPSISDLLLAALPLAPGYEARAAMFIHGSRQTKLYTYRVTGETEESVGGRSIPAWQVDVALPAGPSYSVWVAKETGRILRRETPLGPDARMVALPEG